MIWRYKHMWLQHVFLSRCISTRFCIAVMFLQIHNNGAGKNRHHCITLAPHVVNGTHYIYIHLPHVFTKPHFCFLTYISLFFFLLLRPADLLITNYTLHTALQVQNIEYVFEDKLSACLNILQNGSSNGRYGSK